MDRTHKQIVDDFDTDRSTRYAIFGVLLAILVTGVVLIVAGL